MTTRPSFTTIEDLTTKVAQPIHQAFDGDTATGRNAHGVLPCIDPSGNLRYIRQTAQGQIPVTFDAANQASLFIAGSVTGTDSYQDVATIVLGNSFEYVAPEYHGSCFREAVFELVAIDNAVETSLVKFRVGAGEYNDEKTLDRVKWVSGATGAQSLVLRAKLLHPLPTTEIDGTIAVQENQ